MVWVGGDGMSFVWDCVVCCIGAYPTSPSAPPALRSVAGSTMASTITTRRGPVLLGVRVHSSCFAYSEAPDCSLPGALKRQSSWKCP